MIAIPFSALVLGFLVVYVLLPPVPPRWADYVAIAIVAGLDAFVGAARNWLERRFDEAIFISGFFVNMALAALLAYFGDKLGVDLYLAVLVALGIRIFNNLGRTRALLVTARVEARRVRPAAPSE
ncbi:MAG TPA: small basic family protein [Armatimonadota bacterium]|nr:small basic family protein [Armatimonadota bacterium]